MNCAHCGKKIDGSYGRKYCDEKCRLKEKRKRGIANGSLRKRQKESNKKQWDKLSGICERCGKKFRTGNKNQRFCSCTCAHRQRHEDNGVLFVGTVSKCLQCNKEYIPHNKEQKYCCHSCAHVKLKKPNVDVSSDLPRVELYKWEYKEWRTKVYERDGYVCQICGETKSGSFNAHHLDGWDQHPDKRLDVDNGVTLCKACHMEFHLIYKYGGNKKEQFHFFAQSTDKSLRGKQLTLFG